jgi:hypothetical protein
MGNLALIFHVASLLGFIGLGLWVVYQSKLLRTWRDWNTPEASRRILVGRPVCVLRDFARAIGADFETELADSALPVGRLSLLSAFELHKSGFVERISVKKASTPCVCFVLRHKPSTMVVDVDTMSRELGAQLLLEWR